MRNPELEAKVSHALKIRPNLDQFINELEIINEEYQKDAMVIGLLAHAQWEAGHTDDAVENATWLINNQPTDESASLILFHCLWSMGLYKEAMQETKRMSKSHDYEQFNEFMKSWQNKRKGFDFSNLDKFEKISDKDEADMEDGEGDDEDAISNNNLQHTES